LLAAGQRAGGLPRDPREPCGSSASSTSPARRARGTPRTPSACDRLPATERRSSTGRWNTMPWRRRVSSGVRPAQRTSPAPGRSRPWQSFSSTLLPAPFGPSTIVRAASPTSNETFARICLPPAA
jgi:hypothetical protein